ncbi:DUF309 domain-containing protein [Halalkalibacterium halodurans]|jgi:predicted metal-dependent hydrolase|uniref:DUF309 domain-containing protein n=1 Tax=Halalkalibacterium halodurans TaxID=86665 RepID=A0A0M0KKN7_ALKHA|nr:DUF309 domain-containing protein [Halalkalibacterium halodurans]MDY7222132.1 DUF309 domain-containing protein [Halalkalibacterium halodurans]MDY7241353.1 DUF309 domain-containing protein [Halalkalibacterium halodurans]MED3646803.1 DUF309 domain-containing protein [Halalkalibacterium halodurans]MED4081867.1 DUF309 domain-containing protein [Halalkalibacterium halodurans]MED4086396.1 DUF309 domain-containing protein [Halalkalibacterium halodurans]
MYDEAFHEYLVYFHGFRDYFECHEVLEERWKQDPPGRRKPHWVALIQIAVGLYHERRGNEDGARKMYKNALRLISIEHAPLQELGLDPEKLSALVQNHLDLLGKRPFFDMNLPLAPDVLQYAQAKCREWGGVWGIDSDLTNIQLIEKHSTRDRSQVISERQRQLTLRDEQRKENETRG